MGVGERQAGGPEAGGPAEVSALSDTAWLARAGALTAEAADDHETARAAAAEALAFRLSAIAAALCAAAPDPPLGNRAAAALAKRLAAAAPSAPILADPSLTLRAPAAPASERDARALAANFLEAVGEASIAVYFCRCTQHPGGRCWFSAAGPRDGLCGEVLALAHRLAPHANAG